MGFLERAIRRGVSDAVGKAVGDALTKAIEPTAQELADRAAEQLDAAAANAAAQNEQLREAGQAVEQAGGLGGIFANLEKSLTNYATELGKNMKVCPNCGQPCDGDTAFCPGCGTELPKQTLADGAVCTECGRQNTIGTKFCAGCGAKLPAAIAAEEAAAKADADVMMRWDELLAQYPKWEQGGSEFNIEVLDGGYAFTARFVNYDEANIAVSKYRAFLQQNGFKQAGQYPSPQHLYKMENGVCYHVDTEHCFEGDSDCPTVYFDIREPAGGYDYVKPEPPKQLTLSDIRGLFKK